MYGRTIRDRLAPLQPFRRARLEKSPAPNSPAGVSLGGRVAASMTMNLMIWHYTIPSKGLRTLGLIDRGWIRLYDSDIGGRPWNKKSLYKCSGLPPMSEAEAHAFEVNSFGLYNELSELVELGGADNNLNTSNVETTDYLMLPPDRELSANDYMELNDLLALDPSFSSEFSAQDNQYMQHPLAQYNGHYDLSGPSEPTMPSIFDVFPPNNGVLATDDPANYLDPAMQFPFS
ncbi:hypothetical protein ZEAMMB73_Zm00001d053993 [Zea mays]|uniref:NAC domain-containing protein n=1 Tax=Zea mays TaxID=4577 RepID=A0A1D6QU61_MAIZE|nr:hypothetical protein ZEAMMB73_Zm00001d053993 [Zea mays]